MRFGFELIEYIAFLPTGKQIPDCRETLNDDGVGIDLGIKDLAVCSDGTKYKNINKSQKVKKLEKQKRRLQRSISRSYEKNEKGEIVQLLMGGLNGLVHKILWMEETDSTCFAISGRKR